MRRVVEYEWRLAELMAARGLHTTTELVPLLAERGIELSRTQTFRLVNQRPERVALQVIAALCDIFDCGPQDLLTVTAADAKERKKASNAAASPTGNVVELNRTIRPRRARIIDDPPDVPRPP